jgi:hypothetical protein
MSPFFASMDDRIFAVISYIEQRRNKPLKLGETYSFVVGDVGEVLISISFEIKKFRAFKIPDKKLNAKSCAFYLSVFTGKENEYVLIERS